MTATDRLALMHSPHVAAVWAAAFVDALARQRHGHSRTFELAGGLHEIIAIDASAYALECADDAAELAARVTR